MSKQAKESLKTEHERLQSILEYYNERDTMEVTIE